MGCYDEVLVPCPECGTKQPFQSKGGPCSLTTYELDKAPFDVLSDVNRHAPYECAKCGTYYRVTIQTLAQSTRWDPPRREEDESS